MGNHPDETCDLEIDASKVVEVEACDLPSLNGLMSEESLQQWKQSWQEAIKQADSILELPFPIFWSSLIYSPKILQFIDAFLDVFPRQWELEEMDLYMNRDPLVRSLAIGLYERVLFILLRAIIGRENKTSLSDGFYSRTIYDHKVFTVERLFDLINVYWSSNKAAVMNILKRTIGVQRKYMNDAGNYVDICVQRMDVVAAELNSLTRHPFEKEGCGDRVASLLSMLIGLFEALQIFHPFCCPEIRHKCFASLPISIASLVERLEGYLTEPVFAQLALCALWSTSRSLLRLYDEFRASALQLFHSLISMDKLNEETIATFQEALAYESFIFYYNMVYPINVTLASTISNEHAHDLSKFFNDTLTEISTKQTHMIIDALKNRGLLVQLGNPIDDTISSVLSEIIELLPHFSPQFIHLCLRHFGNDKERTTNALLDTTMLPLDLRALLFADLSLETVPSNTGLQFELPIDDDSEDDIAKDVLESVVDGEVASVASSEMAERQFISMKPPEARQSTTETAGSADLTLGDLKYGVISKQRLPTVEENEMRVKLERLTIAEKNTAEAVRQPPDEICVPLTVGKKHGGLEKFRVPESEKVAQRPLYERYMYEDSKSQWGDVYDDEYDDTFDFQQTFTVDTAQGDEIEVLEGVEPNMNRIVEETAEKEESAEQQNEDAVQRGRGKRAREAALKNKTRTGQQLDPSINASVTEPQADDASGFSTRDTEEDAEVRRSGGPPWLRGTAKGGERRTYTGGRERQLKERNKGSDRRRQADRKMRGGMF